MSSLLAMINRYADRPIYRQVSDMLEARMAEGARPGDRLPSEAELAREYDVNRLTVRRALGELHQRGLIETVHGKGSFVAIPRVRYDVSAGREASFTRTMHELGHEVAIRVLSTESVENSAPDGEFVVAGSVLVCRTLRLVDGQPWSLTSTSIDEARFPGIRHEWDGQRSLYDFLLERHGVRMLRAHRTFLSTLAEPDEADQLQIRVGAAVLEMRGLNVGPDQIPIALVQHRFRGDRIQFTVDLS